MSKDHSINENERQEGWTLQRVMRGIGKRIDSSFKFLVEFPGKHAARTASRRIQEHALATLAMGSQDKVVIFLIPGTQRVTGGGLQIFSLHKMSGRMFEGTRARALICWIPGEGREYHRFEGFKNDVTVFPFDMVLDACKPGCEVQLFLPEYAAQRICDTVGWKRLEALRERFRLNVCIMNQNHFVMPGPEFVTRLKSVFLSLNITAGNVGWVSPEERERFGVPMHYLPTWYYPDDAGWQPYESKSNLMIVSPDKDENRDRILDALRQGLPDLELRVIWGIKYEEYVALEKAARWSLTFGEGLDGYFYGPVLRGGVSFAVRNSTFSLPGLEDKRTIYDDYGQMASRIVEDIKALDSKDAYETYNKSLRDPLLPDFGYDLTFNALKSYYDGHFTLP